MDHILIGITGRRGAGKDTAFRFIQEWVGERGVSAGRRGFADLVKQSFARLFIPDASIDESVTWCDEIKFKGQIEIFWEEGDILRGTRTEVRHKISGRTALQRQGTESHRDVFDKNFWVDALLPTGTFIDENDLPVGPKYPWNFRGPLQMEAPQVCVVTDTRFDNEAERIRQLKGINLAITRDTGFDDTHESEMGVMGELVDFTIVNDGGLDEFRAQVRLFCENELAHRLPQ